MIPDPSLPRHPEGDFGKRPYTTSDDRILQGAWKGRSRGIWAGGYLGLTTGLVLGAAIALVPFAVMIGFTAPLWGGVLACMAATGAIGAATGMAVGASVGESAGPVASGVKEIIRQQNEQFAKLHERVNALGIDAESATPLQETTAPDAEARLPATKLGLSKYVNVKAVLTFVALGAAAGAILSFGPVGAGVMALVATTYGATAAATIPAAGLAAVTAGMFGIAGSVFGVNFPVIFNKTSNAFGEMLAGRAPRTTLTPSPAPAKEIAPPSPSPVAGVTQEEAALLAERQKTASDVPYLNKIRSVPTQAAQRI